MTDTPTAYGPFATETNSSVATIKMEHLSEAFSILASSLPSQKHGWKGETYMHTHTHPKRDIGAYRERHMHTHTHRGIHVFTHRDIYVYTYRHICIHGSLAVVYQTVSL